MQRRALRVAPSGHRLPLVACTRSCSGLRISSVGQSGSAPRRTVMMISSSHSTPGARFAPGGVLRTRPQTPGASGRWSTARRLVGGVRSLHDDQPVENIKEVMPEEKERLQKVQALWEEDKTVEAIAGMHEAVAADPDNYDLIEKLGDMYLAVGDYEASQRHYATAVAILDQHDTRGLEKWTERMSYLQVKLGESKERSQAVDNRFDEAEACYKKAIDLNPKCLEAYHRLGYLNLSEGYTETADELFDEGLRHATGHSLIVAELWYGKAENLLQRKEWRKASKFLKNACEADSTYAPAFFKLGLCLQKEKDWLGAIQTYDKYFDLFPKYYGVHGVDAADQRLDASNLLSDVLLRRGICYIHYGDIEPAITDLDMVIQLDNPKFQALAHHFRGKANFNNSEFWTAIDDQTEAIKHDPELFDAYLDRSTCYDLVGMSKEAIEDKEKYELLKRAKSWDKRQAMLEGYFGSKPRQGEPSEE